MSDLLKALTLLAMELTELVKEARVALQEERA